MRMYGVMLKNIIITFALWLCSLSIVFAAQENFEYDPIGRLIGRYHLDTGELTIYDYDAAGNISSVSKAKQSLIAPTVQSINPLFARRGQVIDFVVTGANLAGARVSTNSSDFLISQVRTTDAKVDINIGVKPDAKVGPTSLVFQNLAGQAEASFTIGPVLPVLTVEGAPLAFPPDGVSRQITLTLSHPDIIDHNVSIVSTDTNKMQVNKSSAVFEKGKVTFQLQISPKLPGFAGLKLESATLLPELIPIFLTTEFKGVNTSHAPAVGILVEQNPEIKTAVIYPISSQLGVVVGRGLSKITPQALLRGKTTTVQINGQGLPSTVQVFIEPTLGLEVGTPVVSSSGDNVSVSIKSNTDTSLGARTLKVLDEAGEEIAFTAQTDSQVYLTDGPPIISSVSPHNVVIGTSVAAIVRGENLYDAKVEVLPANDLFVDAQPVVSADGKMLTFGMQVRPQAVRGLRTVKVTTVAGTTSSESNFSNQFNIVLEIDRFSKLTLATNVGVQVGDAQAEEESATALAISNPVGLWVGDGVFSIQPNKLLIGQSSTLKIKGYGLNAVQTLQIEPSVDLVVGELNTTDTEITVPVMVDASAILGERTVKLITNQDNLAIAEFAEKIEIVAPLPVIYSTEPQVIQVGTNSALLRIRGENFNQIQSVEVLPSQGISIISVPQVNDKANRVDVYIRVASDAPIGERVVVVNTVSGSSTSTSSIANTFKVVQQTGSIISNIMASMVGVQVGTTQTEISQINVLTPVSELVGIEVAGSSVEPEGVAQFITSQNIGVNVGPVITSMTPNSPNGLLQGESVVVQLLGQELQYLSTLEILDFKTGETSSKFTVGEPTLNNTGTRADVLVQANADTEVGSYPVVFKFENQDEIVNQYFSQNLNISVGKTPTVNSVSPIILERSKDYVMTIRGSNLKSVYEVFTDSSSNIEFIGEPQWSTDATGELIQISIRIPNNSALGLYVIRLRVAGGATPSISSPANTVNVVVPQ